MSNQFLTSKELIAQTTAIIDKVCREQAGVDDKKYNRLRVGCWNGFGAMFFAGPPNPAKRRCRN